MSDFIEKGIVFFDTCNKFFATIGMFISNPLKYIIAYGFWLSILVAIIAIFLKSFGFKSEKYIAAGTSVSILMKIFLIMRGV